MKTDAEKLRLLADWFDNRDALDNNQDTEVQDDLRRIADTLKWWEKLEMEIIAASYTAVVNGDLEGIKRIARDIQTKNEKEYSVEVSS